MFNDPELDTAYLKSVLNSNQYYNLNTPRQLLELRKDCIITSRFVDAWMRGSFSFYDCLIKLHQCLTGECVRLNAEFKLDFKYIEEMLKLPEPALPRLYPESPNVRTEVYREICPHNELDLIRVIILASKLHRNFLAIAAEKQMLAPFVVMKYDDGRIEVESNVPNTILHTQVGECGEPQELDISRLPHLS